MAINKKLLHFATKTNFSTQLANSNIDSRSIVFIKDTGEIWTHDKLYSCASWGTNQTNYVPLTIGGKSYDLSKNGHTHSYLPLTGGTLTGDLEIFASNTDKFIKFTYNTTDAYAWRIGYLGTGAGNENRLAFQSAKTSGASYIDALSFGLDDLVGRFAVTPTVGNTKVSLEGHTHSNFTRTAAGFTPAPTTNTTTRYLREDGTWAIPPNTPDTHWVTGVYVGAVTTKADTTVTNPYIKIFDNDTNRGNVQIIGGTNVTVSSNGSKAITINSSYTNTEYLTNTLAHLNTGTDTVGKLQTAKNLNDWLNGKNYATVGYVDDIEIGGRNYVLKGDVEQSYDFEPIGGSGIDYIKLNAYRLTSLLIPYEYYTISMLISGSGNLRPYILGSSQLASFNIANDEPKWFYNTIATYYYPAKDIYLYTDKNTGFSGTIHKIKIEKGNKATDWSPAPEDQVSDWNTTDVNSFSYIKNKPSTFTPSAHTHNASDIDAGVLGIARIPTGTTSTTVALGNHTHSYLPLSGGTISGALTIEGSATSGGGAAYSNYVAGADNIILKGNASGVSGIFFQSEKDGVAINHPSDYGFIQFHPYGVGGVSGENNRLVIGVSNDATDMVVFNVPGVNSLKVRVGAIATEYNVWHAANFDPSSKNASLITSTSTSGITNVATTNTNTYLNIVQGGTSAGSSTQVTGTGSVTVSSDASGKLTINGVNSYLPLSGGTMTGSPYIYFPESANTSNLPDSTPTGLTYGRLQSFGTMAICGDTDGSTTEYVNITAGYSVANAIAANGLSIGYSTLKWKGNTIWHAGNDGSGSGLNADLLDGKHLTELLTSVYRPTNTNNLSIVVGGVTKTIALGSNAFNSDSYLKLTGGTVSGQTNFSDLRLSLINVTEGNYQDINNDPGRLLLKNVYGIPTATTGMLSTMGTILQINGLDAHDKTQLIFNGSNGAIQYRKSWYANTPWTSLRTILDSSNSSVSGNTIKINGTSTTWVNTHRGIQNNLTSQNNTTESLSAHQGYLLANGSARDNTKLALSGGTLTGSLRLYNNNWGSKDIDYTVLSLTPPTHTGGPWNHILKDDSSKAYYTLAYNLTKVFTVNSSGTTTILGTVTAPTFIGALSGNASTATKLTSINTTFTGTYPVTFNVNGTIYSHTGITYTGNTNTLTATNFNGNASSATSADLLDGVHKTAFPQYFHYSRASGGSGWYKIKILSTTSWMVAITVKLYQSYGYNEIVFSGYQYGANYWFSPNAILKTSSGTSITVHFGYDSASNLWVAVPAGNYTGMDVHITNGHTQVADWSNNISVINEAALTGTIQKTQTIYRPLNYDENASTATALTTSAGSATQPVYFSGGKPVAATAYSSASVNYATSAGTATSATNATNTTNINTLADDSSNAARFILFSDAATGNQRAKTDTGLKYNPSSNTITATLAGNATSATLASRLTINSSDSASWFDILWNSGTTVYGSTGSKLRVQPSTGSITSSGTITASGGNSGEWNSAYNYSKIGHLPLSGGTLSGSLIMNNKLTIDNSGRIYPSISVRSSGLYGYYNPDKIAHIWSMGTAYTIPNDGSTFGNLYGLAYKHTNNTTGGTMSGGHQVVWVTNGSPRVALGEDGVWTNGYVTGRRFYTGYDSGQANSMSCSNWFRSSGTTGWYNETYRGGINMTDSTYVRVYNNKAFKVSSTDSDSINTDGGIQAAGNITTSSGFINTKYSADAILLAGGGTTTFSGLYKHCCTCSIGVGPEKVTTGLFTNSTISYYATVVGTVNATVLTLTFSVPTSLPTLNETTIRNGTYKIDVTSYRTAQNGFEDRAWSINLIGTNSVVIILSGTSSINNTEGFIVSVTKRM